MIEKIQIKNFKSIIELELGKLNIFIGENGCGKTNILEAITFGAAASGNKLDNEFLVTRGIRVTDADLMKSKFNKDFENEDVILNFKNDREDIAIGNKYIIELDFEKNKWIFKNSLHEKIKHLTRDEVIPYNTFVLREHTLLEEMSLEDFLNYAPENYFLRRFEEEGQIRPLGIRGEGLFKHLVDIYKKQPELLKEIGEHLRLIGWFEGFEIPTDLMFTERRINIKDKYLQELDFFDQRSANEGFLYLLFYFTLFLSPFTPKFFAIDNIDNSLNPKLCAELIRQLVKISKRKRQTNYSYYS